MAIQKWKEDLMKVIGEEVRDIDMLDDETTLEITFANGLLLRVWGVPDEAERYPELDFQYDTRKV